MARVVCFDRACLSGGWQGPCPSRPGADAAHLFSQQWFNLSDPGAEEALYDMLAMRAFAGVDLGGTGAGRDDDLQVPPLVERHDLGRHCSEVHEHLEQHGLKRSAGTIVDASIIHAPSSTKNAAQARDPEMHPTKRATSGISG